MAKLIPAFVVLSTYMYQGCAMVSLWALMAETLITQHEKNTLGLVMKMLYVCYIIACFQKAYR